MNYKLKMICFEWLSRLACVLYMYKFFPKVALLLTKFRIIIEQHALQAC